MNKPLLSVLIVTYNHAAYIRECLESALAQKTSFDFEIIVGEDCSTDDTRAIIEDMMKKNPERITPIFHQNNVGGHANFISCLEKCRGDWIAWLEGDDLWLDPLKLQKQIGALQSDSSLVLCFTNGYDFESKSNPLDGRFLVDRRFFRQGRYRKSDLLYGNFIPTCTVIFKKSVVWPLPGWYSELPLGDWSIGLLALSQGDAYFLDEPLAAYRRHAQGAWSLIGESRTAENMVVVCSRYLEEFSRTGDRRRLASTLGIWLWRRARIRRAEGRIAESRRDYKAAFKILLASDWWNPQRLIFLAKKFLAKMQNGR